MNPDVLVSPAEKQLLTELKTKLDPFIVVESSEQLFERRASKWDATELPVLADVLVYTNEEWQSLDQEGRFYPTVMQEAVKVICEEVPIGCDLAFYCKPSGFQLLVKAEGEQKS